MATQLHRRKSSKDEDVVVDDADASRTAVNFPRSPPVNPVNGHAHSRTRSFSTPFSSSPLASSSPSYSVPQHLQPDTLPSPTTSRRHSRLHSRNLSIFFPRPGSLPHTTIAEDGAQELEFENPNHIPIPSAGSSVHRAKRTLSGPPTPLGAGFTFGTRRPSIDKTDPNPENGTRTRKGHHHKHSRSHNFFSFLEPGSTTLPTSPNDAGGQEVLLHTQPTPELVSPWKAISPLPGSAHSTIPLQSIASSAESDGNGNSLSPYPPSVSPTPSNVSSLSTFSSPPAPSYSPLSLRIVSVLQFLLGAALWVSGQQNGSLSTTGLGYWVVFDAFGIGIPGWTDWFGVGHRSTGAGVTSTVRRFYGNARVETLLMFAQTVYLMFASVYVCKETVEHVLLSTGEAELESGGHHHHHDDDLGIEFPVFLTFLTSMTILCTSILFNNHSKLVTITGNRIPRLRTILRSLPKPTTSLSTRHPVLHSDPLPSTKLGLALSNPYVASPLLFCVCILSVALFGKSDQHPAFDLLLALLLTLLTFHLSYTACKVLGTVLLQTAPQRGLPNGRMEAFLRTMKEIERHPMVMHLPAPHIWQLIPALLGPVAGSESGNGYANGDGGYGYNESTLVVTMEVHVKSDLSDDDVLALTKWAWDRCVGVLGGGAKGAGMVDVTVGVVRG